MMQPEYINYRVFDENIARRGSYFHKLIIKRVEFGKLKAIWESQ